ncbi:uncharacterized protein rab44 isoform X2 [Chelmon rostratus]|uniref:uncharacterized protein rab44 isoform X2 n=1 Tax=Chelmon rostratus TaxID=109905 RepID=UPI001BE74DFD|nr:uncharacterized protein rab44 isoform X2 [Chelmon rostratus]
MSTQSAKKKRIGSRRRVAHENKTSEADELHITDSASAAKRCIPEENTESLNVLANPDNTQSATQNPPSPELTENRRKLGSSRRNKRELRVKGSATESYSKPTEEVEEYTRGNETPKTMQMSLAIQSWRQEEVNQGHEHNIISVAHDSSLYPAITPDYSEVQHSTTANCPEADLERLIPKSETLEADQDENDTNYKLVSDSCKFVETMLGETDRSDTLQSEELKENARLVGVSELTSVSVLSCPTVDQQLTDQLNYREMPEEKLPNVYSVTEKESKNGDKDAEFLRQGGNLRENYLVSESHIKSKDIESSITPEISTEKHNPREHTEPQCSVGQAIVSSPNEELHNDEEQIEIFKLSDVKGAHHAKDALNSIHEQEVDPTQMHEIDHSSESGLHDAREHSEVISGNLIDQAEVIDTYRSESIVRGTDDSATKQVESNSDDKQEEHPTRENNFDSLEHTNEDIHVYDTKIPQISDTERVDSALGQVDEGDSHIEDDMNPSADQTVHQEKEGILSEVEESESSLQTLQSETNAPLDSQPLDTSVRTEEETNTGFNPTLNRRKLGSSRRNKGRQHAKDCAVESSHEHKEQVEESTRGNEDLQTTPVLVAAEGTNQEELSQWSEHGVIMPVTPDSSLYSVMMPGYSPEVQNPTTTNYPEADLENLISVSENLQEDHDERETDFKVEVSNKSVGATLEGMDKSDTFQSEQARGAHHAEDAVLKVHEQEVDPTQMHEIDDSSESGTHDATEHPEVISGNLIHQAEVIDTYRSESIVRGTDDSATKQVESNSDDKQEEHPTRENNFDSLEHTNEDIHVYDTKIPQISDTERVDSALGQVDEGDSHVEDDMNPSADQTVHQEKEGILSEDEESESSLQTLQSETNAPLDSQPLDTSLRTERETHTGFNPTLNRRKLGSSRRNKGRQHAKDCAAESSHEHKEEVEESTMSTEDLQTAPVLVAAEGTNQEELSQWSEHGVIMPATPDSSLYSVMLSDNSPEVQNPTTTNYPEADLENSISVSENLQEDHDERETDFKVEVSNKSVGATLEGMDKSDTIQSEEARGAHHAEDAVLKVHEQEVDPTQMHEIDDSSESGTHDATEHPEVISGNLIDQAEVIDTYRSESIVRGTDDSATKQEESNSDDKQEEHPTRENNFDSLEHTNEDIHVYDTKIPQISDTERVDSALGQVDEGDNHVEDDMNPSAEQTVHQEKEGILSEVEESESSLQTLQSETNAPLDSQPLDTSVRTERETHTGFNPTLNSRKLGSSRRNKGRQHAKDCAAESSHEHKEQVEESTRGNEDLQTTPVLVAAEGTNQEELSQWSEHDVNMPVTPDSSLYSVMMPGYSPEVQNPTASNYPEADLENSISVSENLQEDHDERETDFKVEVSNKSVGATLEGMDKSDTFQSEQARGAHHAEDAVLKEHEQEVNPTQMHEIDDSSESETHDATEHPEVISGNLIDQPEVIDTYQSESIVRGTDDSATKQEDSNSDDKQEEHPTRENYFDSLEHTNEDIHVYDTKIPQISDTERVDSALGQVDEGESHVEDDMNPSAEQTVHQEKEGILSEDAESESSLQTLQSETNAPLDSQPLDTSLRTEEETHTGFNPTLNRRKLGLSRRNKGRQHAKDCAAESSHEHKEQVEESTRGNEDLLTIPVLVAAEGTNQEELSQWSEHGVNMPVTPDSSLYSVMMPGYSPEVQNPTASNYPEADLENSISVSENLQEDHDERETDFKVEVSNKSVGATLEGMDKSDTFQSEQARGAHHAEDAVLKVHEQEVDPTQMHEIDDSSESGTHDATEHPEVISGNLIDQAEVIDTYRSESIVRGIDDSATKQVESNSDDKQEEHPTRENNFDSLEHTNEDIHVYDTKIPQISDTERVDSALGQVDEGDSHVEDDMNPSAEQTVHQEKEGILSEDAESESSLQTLQSETNAPLDSQPLDTSVRTEEVSNQEKDGLFSETERGKSSLETLQSEIHAPLDSQPQQNDTGFSPIGNRRKLGSSRRNKGRQLVEDSVAESYHRHTGEIAGNTKDHEPLEIVKMSVETEVPEKSMETMPEGMDTFDTAQTPQIEECSNELKETAQYSTLVGISEHITSGLHSSLAVDQQLINQSNSTEMPKEKLPGVYSVTEKQSKDGDGNAELSRQDGNIQDNYLVSESRVKSENPGDRTDIECSVEQAASSSSSKGKVGSESSLQALQSETNALLDSQPQDNSVRMEKQTHKGFNPTGCRRKLGSSRRNKGQQHVKDSVSETHHKPKEEFSEDTRSDHALETTKMPLATETIRQEELKKQTNIDLEPAQESREMRSTINAKENTEKMPEEDRISSQNVTYDSTIATTDITSSSGKDDSVKSNKDVNEEENNLIKEPENVSHFTGYDTAKMDLIQSPEDDSDTQNISCHVDSVCMQSVTSDVLEQNAHQVQKTEALSCDKDSLEHKMSLKRTNDAMKTVADVSIKDCLKEAESSMDVQVFGQDGDGEKCEDPTKKDHETEETNAPQEVTYAELSSAAHGKTGASAQLGLEENFRAETAVDAPEESGISAAVGACNSQQGIQETTNSDNSENVKRNSKQRRRKMGSTRHTQLKRKPEEGTESKNEIKESDFNKEDDVRNFDNMEVVRELPVIVTAEVSQNISCHVDSVCFKGQQETDRTSTVHDEGQRLQSSTSDLQRVQSSMISDVNDLTALLPEQSASNNGKVDNPVKFVQVAGIRDSERNVDVNVEPSQLDDFTCMEMHPTSVLSGGNSSSVNPLRSSNTVDVTSTGITGGSSVSSCEPSQSTQNDEEMTDSVNVAQAPALNSAEAPAVAVVDLEIMKPVVRGGAGEESKDAQAGIHELNNANEGAHDKNLEMKNASPNFNSANRRRKMGSTRRNLGSRSKGEDLHQKQEADKEATGAAANAGDVKSEPFLGIKEKEELQLLIEDKDSDSDQRKEKVFETVECSLTGESHFKPPAQHTSEENPPSHDQLEEKEHHLTPSYFPATPSTSPNHDGTSETAGGRRRRKLGSHRKSHGHQSNVDQTARGDKIIGTQDRRDVRSVTDESAIKTTEEESVGLDKISEADESSKKPSSNVSASEAVKHSTPESEKTPARVTAVQHRDAEIRPGQESQKPFSLGSSGGAAPTSSSYNVLMVGNSCVGKTSFMKRAQSGKFSLDLPASAGLDFCMWTVVVDGKPVVLRLWDTAGQERFRSITKQIFHKAQAFLLMYDITSSQSFSAVSHWATCIQEGAAENVTILLLGNKSDCAERVVKAEEGEILAKEYNFEFMECSAATGENVLRSLETVARILSQKVDTREETTVLHKEPQQKKSSGCC